MSLAAVNRFIREEPIMSTARLGRAYILLFVLAGVCEAAPVFQQTDLVSSVPSLAPVTDPNLKNPWGIAFSPTGPFWIANQVTGTATVYDAAGQPVPPGSPLVVTIPGSGGPSGPTGMVFNPTSDFRLAPGPDPSIFLFATLDGRLAGWNPAVNPAGAVITAAATDGAVYTGLALGSTSAGNFLYAADAANGKIDVYDAAFGVVTLSGSFTDPTLPAGFTPYNIQNLGGTLYVTYENEIAGGGIVDAFDLNGNLIRRVSANGAGGPLDDPWGLALAPAGFGDFGGALLVGNEGDGRISAFDPLSGDFLGQLADGLGDPIANPGLWGLTFGNGGVGGDPEVLYFVAGIRDEAEGLFGSIRSIGAAAVPEPSSLLLLGIGIVAMLRSHGRRTAPGLPAVR
jgi:uncharacterized protein (TIGR03118 family)